MHPWLDGGVPIVVLANKLFRLCLPLEGVYELVMTELALL
jgi:hypothetical protein